MNIAASTTTNTRDKGKGPAEQNPFLVGAPRQPLAVTASPTVRQSPGISSGPVQSTATATTNLERPGVKRKPEAAPDPFHIDAPLAETHQYQATASTSPSQSVSLGPTVGEPGDGKAILIEIVKRAVFEVSRSGHAGIPASGPIDVETADNGAAGGAEVEIDADADADSEDEVMLLIEPHED